MSEILTNDQVIAELGCIFKCESCLTPNPADQDKGCRKRIRRVLAADLLDARAQRDTAWQELREIREAIKADENESTADEVRSLVSKRDEYRVRLSALEDIATAVEADIDCGRPLEYNVEHLRDELIRARAALGILPEQDQQKEASHVD